MIASENSFKRIFTASVASSWNINDVMSDLSK